MVEGKACKLCGEFKTFDQYGVQKNVKDGRKSRCKTCLAELSRKYNTDNPDKRRNAERNWRESNPDKVRDMAKRSRTKHADSYRERLRRWKTDNKERVAVNHQRRRAMKRSLRDDYTDRQRVIILEVFDGCALSGSRDNVHLDHFIALDTGHGGTWCGNMIPLKETLNLSKGAKNPFEWVKGRTDIDLTRFWLAVDILAAVNEMTREEYVLYVYFCYENPIELSEVS
ncbi:hypothetical protein [Paenibacillus sp. TC-CSREp1]|uniref:hypothetical protein n=1 Tax=Paenibacillus sp. TC-CSREp1 TaxID=3410089 RepID=UPI003CEA5219